MARTQARWLLLLRPCAGLCLSLHRSKEVVSCMAPRWHRAVHASALSAQAAHALCARLVTMRHTCAAVTPRACQDLQRVMYCITAREAVPHNSMRRPSPTYCQLAFLSATDMRFLGPASCALAANESSCSGPPIMFTPASVCCQPPKHTKRPSVRTVCGTAARTLHSAHGLTCMACAIQHDPYPAIAAAAAAADALHSSAGRLP